MNKLTTEQYAAARRMIIDAIDSQIPSGIGHRAGYIIPSLEDCADAILAALDENKEKNNEV
jgi:hypothetical protein